MKNLIALLNAKALKVMIVLQLISFSFTNAQWNFQLSTNQEFNTNPFRSVDPTSDFISTFDVGIQKEISDFSLLYYGSYNKFNTSTEIDYYWHQLGFFKETESITWGAYFEQRFNRDVNDFFNYLNYAAYIRKPFQLFDFSWDANISYSSMNYSVIPDFNNWVVASGLSTRRSFETKTTIFASAILNYKGFKNYYSNIDSSFGTHNVLLNSESVNITQLVLNARIAQSLAENTGLALNYNLKKILSGSGFSASLIESTYGEIELYEDPVSQEGYSVGALLTQILPADITLKLAYSYADKSYPSQGIYLSETEGNLDVSRNDIQTYFSTSISKPFYFDNESGSELNLKLNYQLIKNTSNSYFFNYDINTVSLSLYFIF